MQLYLIRHAEVESRYQRVFGGRIDMNLSPVGRQQVEALSRFFHQHPFHAFYASPMKRARQTLEGLHQVSGHKPVFLDGLREVDFGAWTGLSWQEVEDQYSTPAGRWLDQLHARAIPDAECPKAWRERVQESFNHILPRHPEQNVAVVCHGGVIRMALSILLDISLVRTASFEIEYASVTRIDYSQGQPRIRYLNLAPWRDVP